MIKIPKECQKQDLTVTPSKRVLSSPPTQYNGTKIVILNPKFHFKIISISIDDIVLCETKKIDFTYEVKLFIFSTVKIQNSKRGLCIFVLLLYLL